MEGGLIRTWFKKLIQALRIDGPHGPSATVDSPEERHIERFVVRVDGISIRGWILFPAARPSKLYPALIMCHGIPAASAPPAPGDVGYEGLAHQFASIGIASVFFNFRGCGESEGNFDIAGWARDMEAVLAKIPESSHIDPTRLMVLGFSAGGAASVKVASETSKIFGLALAGTPAHFDMFQQDASEIVHDFRLRGIIRDPDFPPDSERWLQAFSDMEPRRWIPDFKGQYLLIVHGDQDELISVDHAHQLKEAAPAGVAELSIIPGGVHKLRLDKRCIDAVEEWILKILGRRFLKT